MYRHVFFSFIDKTTRYTNTSATLLDHINTNKILQNCWPTPGILKFNISDHLPTFLQPTYKSQFKVNRILSLIQIVRNIKHFNVEHFYEDFCLLLQKQISSIVNNYGKPMIRLIIILNDTIKKHAPLTLRP